MKMLIHRFSRIANSCLYSPLRSDRRSRSISKAAVARAVPHGHVPIYVGDEMERFVISTEYLNHPVFIGLLNMSAQEYGYEQKGGLRVPCQVCVFERILEDFRIAGVEASVEC